MRERKSSNGRKWAMDSSRDEDITWGGMSLQEDSPTKMTVTSGIQAKETKRCQMALPCPDARTMVLKNSPERSSSVSIIWCNPRANVRGHPCFLFTSSPGLFKQDPGSRTYHVTPPKSSVEELPSLQERRGF
ncbi:uncharacterized protein RHO17_021875 [Thomomys bottae]